MKKVFSAICLLMLACLPGCKQLACKKDRYESPKTEETSMPAMQTQTEDTTRVS